MSASSTGDLTIPVLREYTVSEEHSKRLSAQYHYFRINAHCRTETIQNNHRLG